MIHRSTPILLSVLMLATLCCCTHNNGDIGVLFGQWKVESIETNGEMMEDYGNDLYFSFQSGTVEIKQILPHHEAWQSFGNWSLDGDKLSLDFPDHGLQPPVPSLIPRRCVLSVVKLDRNHAVFRLERVDESPVTYTLKKW